MSGKIKKRFIFSNLLIFLLMSNLHAHYDGPGLYQQAIGATVILNQKIESTQGARIHIQNGEIKPLKEIAQLDPYCYFYSTRQSNTLETPLVFLPGQFTIEAVIRRREVVLSSPRQYAFIRNSFESDGVQYTLATRFQLNAPTQPDLSSLVCGVWADPRDRSYVSYEEIQKTLGSIANLRF